MKYIPVNAAQKAYERGETVKQLAARYGVSPALVRLRLIDAGVTMRPAGHPNGYKQKCKLTDRELQEAFDSGADFQAIATRAGLTRERIRQIYMKRFATEEFPNGRSRQAIRTMESKLAAAQDAWPEVVKRVAAKATELGYEAIPTIWKTQGVSAKHTLLINNRRVRVHHVQAKPRHHGMRALRLYHHVHTRDRTVDFHVVVIHDRTFIIPTEVISPSGSIFIPLERQRKPVYKNQYPIVDWLDYEERWDLLK